MTGVAVAAPTSPAVRTGPATIAVIGVAGAQLPPEARERLSTAALVAGGARHLAAHAPPGARRVRLTGNLAPALAEIEAARGPVVVLASGDPGFFGIVRRLAQRLGPERLDVLPAPSSVALAFARISLAWDDALVVSAHGRDPHGAVNAARAHPKVAVLTEPGFPPAQLAVALHGWPRRIVVAERLGDPSERLTEGSAQDIARRTFAEPNVAIVLDPTRLMAGRVSAWPPRSARRWALPEKSFDHRDGMITKAEVRALALARLGPGTGDLVWDVGAGSGSVGIECARLGAAVVAVERDPEACARIRANAEAHRVSMRVERGEALGELAALPDPDAVFVGGGGAELRAILDAAAARARRCVVAALATVERVAPALERLSAAGLDAEATMVQASRMRPMAGAHRLAAGNPVFVVCGERR
jgi:precorrin-6Y C5,15-methyltransferase (decarboxylating)